MMDQIAAGASPEDVLLSALFSMSASASTQAVTTTSAPSTGSAVWNFFSKESPENAKCLVCNQIYSRKGRGTTSLKSHLRSRHEQQYAELLEEEEKRSRHKRQYYAEVIEEGKKILEENDSVKTPLQNVKCDNRQIKVEKCHDSVMLWDDSHARNQEMDKYISEMLVMDDLPMSHVEGVGFTRFMSKVAPEYRLKQQNFYSTLIYTNIYDAVCAQVKTMLSDITNTGNSISFSTDVWSDTSAGVSLLGFTAHAISSNFERVSFVLGGVPLDERHTSSRKFCNMLKKWRISPNSVQCVVCDSGAILKNATFLSGLNTLDCARHSIQLAVEQGFLSQEPVSDIIGKCRKLAMQFQQSATAQGELKKLQERLRLPNLRLIHDTPVRWNSTLHMFQRMEQIKLPLCMYVTKDPNMPQLTDVEWLILSQCVQALKPYEELDKKMSNSASTVADVIPLILCLKKVVQSTNLKSTVPVLDSNDKSQEEYHNAWEIVNYMKEVTKAEIDGRLAGLEMNSNYTVATYLDPRYKGKFFSSSLTVEHVQRTVADLCDELTSVGVGEDGEPRKKRKRYGELKANSLKGTATSIESVMALILESSSDDETEERTNTNTLDMVREYHKEKRLGVNEDPLMWWKVNINKYPELGKLAQQYLNCPASSVTSEQLFSGATSTYKEKRNYVQGEKAEKLLFLKKNLPLLKFEY